MSPIPSQGWSLAKVPQETRTVGFCFGSSSYFSHPASLPFAARPSICGLRLTWRIFLPHYIGR